MTSAPAHADVLPPLIARRPAGDAGAPGPLWTEWTLTNGVGGYAMGSVLGVPTRRYHGLLVAAARPPVERIVTLAAIHETVILPGDDGAERREHLTPFHFAGSTERAVWDPRLARFEHGRGSCEWTYRIDAGPGGPLEVRKRVRLLRGRQAVAVRYETRGASCRLELRPLVAMRGFHRLDEGADPGERFHVEHADEEVRIEDGPVDLRLWAPGAEVSPGDERWRSIEHAWEIRRGLEAVEDLHAPAIVCAELAPGGSVELLAAADDGPRPDADADESAQAERDTALVERSLDLAGVDRADAEAAAPIARLALAGDEFVVARSSGVSVIAGYPWFADWGRDSMISLPGLLLVTGRLGEALDVLRTFAGALRRGLIPNRFDDYDAPAHYNTVDAPLWFVHAAHEYLAAGGDGRTFAGELLPACVEIVEAYRAGTDHGIGIDHDGLVFAGDAGTQLTWMDAQRDGVTFTPRHGKAVEINALWYNALRWLAGSLRGDDATRAGECAALADRVRDSFRAAFVTFEGGLIDHRTPGPLGWAPSGGVRPNQVFAASLPHSPLDAEQSRRVLDEVRRELLTPFGLRTLARAGDPGSGSAADPGSPYRGRYEGSLFERDAAYHNGTAWPWLVGPYAEAVMRVGAFSGESRAEARRALAPLVRWLEDGWSPGQLPEIFDGEGDERAPQRPDGCPAQAWSIAEVLRVWVMTIRGS